MKRMYEAFLAGLLVLFLAGNIMAGPPVKKSIRPDPKGFKPNLPPHGLSVDPDYLKPRLRGYTATVDFSYAGAGYLKIIITDLDKAGAVSIKAFVKTSHPVFSGMVTFTEDTTKPGVFSGVQPFIWTQGVFCEVTYVDERTGTGQTNVQRRWRYVAP